MTYHSFIFEKKLKNPYTEAIYFLKEKKSYTRAWVSRPTCAGPFPLYCQMCKLGCLGKPKHVSLAPLPPPLYFSYIF